MFDIGASELAMVAVVAIVVIGPKDMPLAMRTAGRWIGKMRKISNHFRAGIDAMVREAELEDMERKWREQNEAIMKASPVLPGADAMQPPIADPVEQPGREQAALPSSDSPPDTSQPDALAPQADATAAGQSDTGLRREGETLRALPPSAPVASHPSEAADVPERPAHEHMTKPATTQEAGAQSQPPLDSVEKNS